MLLILVGMFITLFISTYQPITLGIFERYVFFAILVSLVDSFFVIFPGKTIALSLTLCFAMVAGVNYGATAILWIFVLSLPLVILRNIRWWKGMITSAASSGIAYVLGLWSYLLVKSHGDGSAQLVLAFAAFCLVSFAIEGLAQFLLNLALGFDVHGSLHQAFGNLHLIALLIVDALVGVIMIFLYNLYGLWGVLLVSVTSAAVSIASRAYFKLVDESSRDELTGIYNRKFLRKSASKMIGKEKLFSLMMIDIDRFKVFNDSLGHVFGDRLLKEVSQFLSDQAAPFGTVFRYGGEEFCVLLPNYNSSQARELADKIRQNTETHAFGGIEAIPIEHLTVSIGLSTYPKMALSYLELVEQADKALYIVKSTTRNAVRIYSTNTTTTNEFRMKEGVTE